MFTPDDVDDWSEISGWKVIHGREGGERSAARIITTQDGYLIRDVRTDGQYFITYRK